MNVRDATVRDADAIAAIWGPVISGSVATFNAEVKTPQDVALMIETRQQDGFGFLVAEDGGVLGFATYGQFRGGIGYRHSAEHTVILAPQAGGRGVGRALMAAIEDHAKARGFHSMIAGVAGENDAGVGFHAALGYATVAHIPQVGRKFDRWMDLIVMQKFLNAPDTSAPQG